MAFNISYVYQAIDRFTPVANKIQRSVDSINQKVSQAGEGIKSFGSKLSSAGESLRSFGTRMTAFATTSIGYLGYSLIKAASDAEETRSKFEVVFSSISKDANTAAMELAKNYGLSRTSSKDLLSATGDLLTGFGFSQDKALDLSVAVQKLAVDLTSFKNYAGGAEGASNAITKALLGEREMLKGLGIAINEEMVKTKILTLIKNGEKFKTLEQARAAATLALVMEKGKNALGDYARTANSTANKTRAFQERLEDLKETLGKKLEPLFNRILNALVPMIDKIEAFIQKNPDFAQFAFILAGITAIIGPLALGIGILIAAFSFLLTPVMLVGVAIAAVAAGIVALATYFPKLKPVIVTLAGAFLMLKAASMLAGTTMMATPWGAMVMGAGALTAAMVTYKEEIYAVLAALRLFNKDYTSRFAQGANVKVGADEFNKIRSKLEGRNPIEMLEGRNIIDKPSAAIPMTGSSVAAYNVLNRSVIDMNVSLEGQTDMVKDVRSVVRGSNNANVGINMAGGVR